MWYSSFLNSRHLLCFLMSLPLMLSSLDDLVWFLWPFHIRYPCYPCYHCIIYIFFCWFIWSMLEGGVVNINSCKSLVMTGFTCVTLRIIINLIGLVKSILILYHNKENPNLSYLGIFPHLFIIILYNFSLFCFMFQSHASIY